jgi:hypothetical protein
MDLIYNKIKHGYSHGVNSCVETFNSNFIITNFNQFATNIIYSNRDVSFPIIRYIHNKLDTNDDLLIKLLTSVYDIETLSYNIELQRQLLDNNITSFTWILFYYNEFEKDNVYKSKKITYKLSDDGKTPIYNNDDRILEKNVIQNCKLFLIPNTSSLEVIGKHAMGINLINLQTDYFVEPDNIICAGEIKLNNINQFYYNLLSGTYVIEYIYPKLFFDLYNVPGIKNKNDITSYYKVFEKILTDFIVLYFNYNVMNGKINPDIILEYIGIQNIIPNKFASYHDIMLLNFFEIPYKIFDTYDKCRDTYSFDDKLNRFNSSVIAFVEYIQNILNKNDIETAKKYTLSKINLFNNSFNMLKNSYDKFEYKEHSLLEYIKIKLNEYKLNYYNEVNILFNLFNNFINENNIVDKVKFASFLQRFENFIQEIMPQMKGGRKNKNKNKRKSKTIKNKNKNKNKRKSKTIKNKNKNKRKSKTRKNKK